MRLLVLSSSFPYPVDVGRKAVLSGFLEYAVTALGRDNVVLLCVSSDRTEEDAAPLSPCRVVFFSPASAVLRASLVAFNSLLLRRRAIQEMLVAAPGIGRHIATFLDGFDPDILLIDTLRMVQHVPSAARRIRRCVLYLDDLYSLRYSRILLAMRDHPDFAINALGTFDRFLPGPFRRLMRSRVVQRPLLALESEILARREVAMPRQFDQILLLNADEADLLVQRTGAKNVSTVMPLVRHGHPGEALKRRFTGDPTFLFLGNLRYSANAHGLSLFLKHAMPTFLARVPQGRLLIVGAGADRELRELGGRFEKQVSFLDYVENLDALCCSVAGMVVPLVFGSGVKIKVIEALARGLPMVSTHIGIEGLGLESGTHCLVEDDPVGFADAMVRLLDPVFNADLGRQSFAYYTTHLAPEAVTPRYRAALFGDLPTKRSKIQRLDRDHYLKLSFRAAR
jgi:glycosyltransferase involved in cell wall biosynthesis